MVGGSRAALPWPLTSLPHQPRSLTSSIPTGTAKPAFHANSTQPQNRYIIKQNVKRRTHKPSPEGLQGIRRKIQLGLLSCHQSARRPGAGGWSWQFQGRVYPCQITHRVPLLTPKFPGPQSASEVLALEALERLRGLPGLFKRDESCEAARKERPSHRQPLVSGLLWLLLRQMLFRPKS